MQWDDLFTDPANCLREPSPEVVAFEPVLRDANCGKVLDLGCGAGRNAVYLSERGYDVVGMDISPRGVGIARERLRAVSREAGLVIADMLALPFRGGAFDAVVCRGVITHNTRDGVRTCIEEIARTTRTGGRFLCTFISPKSSMFGQGERIDDFTFICDDAMERGVVHYFMDRPAVMAAVGGLFRVDRLDHAVHGREIDTGRAYISAHWILTATRI